MSTLLLDLYLCLVNENTLDNTYYFIDLNENLVTYFMFFVSSRFPFLPSCKGF